MESGTRGRLLGAILGGALVLTSSAASAQQKPVTLEYFSWSIFRLTSPNGQVILTNPFVTNPDSPVKVENFPKVDAIVVADGHQDEVGSSAEIALATGAKIVTSFEMLRLQGPGEPPGLAAINGHPHRGDVFAPAHAAPITR